MNFVNLILFIFIYITCVRCEILTYLAGSAIGSLGYFAYKKYNCAYWECCTDEYVHPDLDSK